MSDKEAALHARRMRTRAAAEYVGSSKSTLEKLRLTGGGPPFIKLGRTVVYDSRDLDEWLAARKRLSTSDIGGARMSAPAGSER